MTVQPDTSFEVDMRLHQALATSSTPFNLSLGLPALPFQVKTSGGVNVQIGFDYELAFTYTASSSTPFAVDTSKLLLSGPGAGHEMSLNVVAGLAPGFNATVIVGFIQGQATDHQGLTSMNVAYNLDGLAPGGPVTATPSGSADIDLDVKGGFSGSNSDAFPSISTELKLTWDLASGNTPDVSFENVTLDLGQFLSGVIEPVLNVIQDVTSPLEPVLKVIDAPIPGLSDISRFLGEGNITLLGLATVAAQAAGFGEFAGLADDVIQVVELIQELNLGSEITLPLGNFDLNTSADDQILDSNVVAGDISNLDLTSLSDLAANVLSQKNISQIEGLLPTPFASVLQQLTEPAFNLNFTLPILDDPANGVFGLLLGRDATLFSLTAEMHIKAAVSSADGGASDGLSIAGVGLSFGGFVQADAKFTFGYDTHGLRELINDLTSNDPSKTSLANIASDVTDGFYVDSSSYLSVSGGIYAEAGGSAGIVSVGVQGGIFTGSNGQDPITIKFGDPDHDGKVRFNEFAGAISSSGELDASLVVNVSIGVTFPIVGFVGVSHDFGLASVVLLDLNNPPTVVHTDVLASQPDGNGNVTLYVGRSTVAARCTTSPGRSSRRRTSRTVARTTRSRTSAMMPAAKPS